MKTLSVDVLVAGGGTAGIGAAIASARAGARTLLVERHGGLGGMAFSALVHTMCGLYRLREDVSEPLEFSNPGLPKEFAERLIALGGAKPAVRMGRLDVLPHRPSSLAFLADRMSDETPGLEVFLHTEIVAVHTSTESCLGSLELRCRGSLWEIETRAVVDCTGDGEVAAMAGATFATSPAGQLQRPAWIFGIGGVVPGSVSGDARLLLAHAIASAVTSGKLPAEALGVAFREGMSASEAWATIDLQADPFDPCSTECLRRVEKTGRATTFAVMDFLRTDFKGFEKAFLAETPAQAGIRESRRITGLSELTEEDILSGQDAPEAAAYASWPLELRENAKGPKFRFPQNNRSAAIPSGCLRSRDFTNLFMAGRCISATHGAQASIRVTGTCMATGEAAGKIAAQSM